MSVVLDVVLSEPSALTDDRVYDLAAVRAAADRVIDLPRDGLLAVRQLGIVVSFAVFSRAYGDAAGDVKLSLVVSGEGTGSPLREMRHTYWGEDGYLFYAPGSIIIAALTALDEWFDVR